MRGHGSCRVRSHRRPLPLAADDVRLRIGDVVVAARGAAAFVRRGSEPLESGLFGHDGSLTSTGRLVPVRLAADRRGPALA